jgi:hypothetical protein
VWMTLVGEIKRAGHNARCRAAAAPWAHPGPTGVE